MNPFKLISELNDAAQAGKAMSDPSLWADRAQMTTYAGAAITSALGIANTFHLVPPVCEANDALACIPSVDVQIVASGVALLLFWAGNLMHKASNEHAGK